MTVPKIKTDQGFVPDIPQAIEPYVLGYSLNADGETYTLNLSPEWYESQIISPAQGRTQLHRMGLLQTAAEAVAQIGGELEIFWEYATQWDKNSQAVQSLAQQFDIDLDDFFDKARKITV
jgi:hypothetical protein